MHLIQRTLEELAECLCKELEKHDPPVCFCGVLAGGTVALDRVGECETDGQNGMAWTRLALTYPVKTIGRIDETLRNCGAGMGFEVELGVMRLAPDWGMENVLEPPSAAEELAAARLATDDMLAMYRAIQCCLDDTDYVAQAYRPAGPQGGVVGGTINVVLAI